ncbi:unnamed protein product [Rotaria socialis]|uniref:G-protein coupled receptors family 1 profile domain-containing protein n=1 Tax=Rotaria socialis TaxID=392032 RepID=A0A820RAE1_9BILA|nr:unnamed protein product [Rotaria socialis]CAF4432699.1 unnamed protein product [Rotaria socialis]
MSQDFNGDMNASNESDSLWDKYFHSNTSVLFSFTLFFAYAIIFLVGLIGNIFVIIVIIKFRRMRTLTNRFLLNLAISDLLATLICIPPNAYHHYDKRWIFGEFFCRFVPFIQGTSVAVSIFTLMAVSVDRFIAIHKPIHSKLLCTSTRIFAIIAIIWITSFFLMIPLIVHHRLIDPFDTMLTACAEEWHQNMNARLVYDFILLFLLFIIPLTLMTYCYIRISFSLWFVDSYFRKSWSSSSSSTTNIARFSTISEDTPQVDMNDIRRSTSAKTRPYYIHYHKTYENDFKRKQQQQNDQKNQDEYRSLINSSGKKLISNSRPGRSKTINDIKQKSSSVTATTMTTTITGHTTCRRSSSLIGRHFGENTYTNNNLNQSQQGRQISAHHGKFSSLHTSGTLRSSFTYLPNHNRILGSVIGRINGNNSNNSNINNNNNNNSRRSTIDVERASRFLKSRRRVVKLLITLVIVFFVSRLPSNILSIYIDITSNTYLPDNIYTNRTKIETIDDETIDLANDVANSDRKMTLVLYVNPILQLISLSNSVINPLCYCVMSHAVKNIITLIRQKLRRRGQNKSSLLPLTQRPAANNQSMQRMIQHRNSFENNRLNH